MELRFDEPKKRHSMKGSRAIGGTCKEFYGLAGEKKRYTEREYKKKKWFDKTFMKIDQAKIEYHKLLVDICKLLSDIQQLEARIFVEEMRRVG